MNEAESDKKKRTRSVGVFDSRSPHGIHLAPKRTPRSYERKLKIVPVLALEGSGKAEVWASLIKTNDKKLEINQLLSYTYLGSFQIFLEKPVRLKLK